MSTMVMDRKGDHGDDEDDDDDDNVIDDEEEEENVSVYILQ